MTYKPHFFIPTADLKEKIKQKHRVQLVDFTVLSHLLTSNIDAELSLLHECILAFPKEFIRNFVCLQPERLIEHEILAQLQAGIKLDKSVEDEADTFGQAFTWVQQSLSSEAPRLQEECFRLFGETQMEVEQFFDALMNTPSKVLPSFPPKQSKQLLEFYNELSQKEFWQDSKESLKAVCVQRAMALIYTQRVQAFIQPSVKAHISELCRLKKLEQLNPVEKSDGVAIFTTGGVASGKGSCLKNISETLKERHPRAIEWDEIVHHNADRLKPFLLNPKVDPLKYSQYTYEEALLIKERVMKIIEQEGEVSGRFPHLLHDQTKLKGEELKEASKRYGEMIITAVSTDAASAIERAYSRGEATTRFEHTEGLLGSHQAVPGEFIKALNQDELIGQGQIGVVMYDNNSPSRQLTIFASIDMQNKQLIIYDDECMQAWIKKENINPKAKSEDELYSDKPIRTTEEYFAPLIAKGFSLEIRPKVESSQDDNVSIVVTM